MRATLVAVCGFLLPFFCLAAPLPRSEPEVQQVDPNGVLAFLRAVEESHLTLHSFMLVRHGKVVAEGWWKPYRPELAHTLYSLTKSFTATAAGLAVAEGKLSLDDKVAVSLHDELPPVVSENLAAMRVRDLLTMTAGHAKDPISTISVAPTAGRWVRAVLTQPVAYAPGTHFTYSNGSALLLSAMVQNATGQTPHDYLQSRLFAPLGITGEDWETYADGRNVGGWGLRLKTEDLAKFGELYLQKGNWEGRQVLPPAWVEQASSRQSPSHYGADPDFAQGYGYMFWLTRHGAYRGFGSLDEVCLIMPTQDAVLAITAENYASRALSNAIWDHILPALLDSALPAPTVASGLQAKLRSLSLPVPIGTDFSSVISRINGRTYAMTANTLGVTKVTLTFLDGKCLFGFWDARGYHAIISGLARWSESKVDVSAMNLHLAATSAPGMQDVSGSAAWPSADTLEMFWQFIDTAQSEAVRCVFDGDTISLAVMKSTARNRPGARLELTGVLGSVKSHEAPNP